jgi:hypothetical protein
MDDSVLPVTANAMLQLTGRIWLAGPTIGPILGAHRDFASLRHLSWSLFSFTSSADSEFRGALTSSQLHRETSNLHDDVRAREHRQRPSA